MVIFLLLLIVSFFFPIFSIPLLLFTGLLVIFLPFKFTIDSFYHLLYVPKQIYQIAINPDLRRNHALEHATVNILEREMGYRGLAGYAEENGFYIIGADDVLAVEDAARRGLHLLKTGREELAIHDRCGTSLTVASFVSALIFIILLLTSGNFSFFNMIIAVIISNFIGPQLGQIMQKHFTTSIQVSGIEIVSFKYVNTNYWNQPVKIYVHTRIIPFLE